MCSGKVPWSTFHWKYIYKRQGTTGAYDPFVWCCGGVGVSFCLFSFKKKYSWSKPRGSFWKTFKCQTAVVTQDISNTGFVNSLYWRSRPPEILKIDLRECWIICHLSLDCFKMNCSVLACEKLVIMKWHSNTRAFKFWILCLDHVI